MRSCFVSNNQSWDGQILGGKIFILQLYSTSLKRRKQGPSLPSNDVRHLPLPFGSWKGATLICGTKQSNLHTPLYLEEVVLWEMHLGSKLTNSLIYSRYPARSTLLTEKGGRENMNSHMYNMEYLHTLKKECITWNTFTHSKRMYNME
jgi:hypothetical protein